MHLRDRIFAAIRAANLPQRSSARRAAFIRQAAWRFGIAEDFLRMYVEVELRLAREATEADRDTAPYPCVRRIAA